MQMTVIVFRDGLKNLKNFFVIKFHCLCCVLNCIGCICDFLCMTDHE